MKTTESNFPIQLCSNMNSKQPFFWRKVMRNSRELSRSSEMYSTKQKAIQGLKAEMKLSGAKEFTYLDITGSGTQGQWGKVTVTL